MNDNKRYLVTSALPYANGPLHFGHLAGVYLPADVYVRHLKLLGKKAIHISGSDEHGVAIMLNAQKVKKNYKEYVDHWHESHAKLFSRFQVDFDFFGQTSSDYHREEVIKWFEALHKKGFITPQDSEQLQCQDCHSFLPDRFVKGTCYECGYEEARGDECPNCGILIDPIRLKNPQCQICRSHNTRVTTVAQYYLRLSKFKDEFNRWLHTKKDSWRSTVYPFVEALCREELHDRAISRDLDWGIDVPLPEAKGKKLYVWFDAPIGYVSNTKKMLEEQGSSEDYLKDWWQNSETEIVHFIGKDNIIFHCIIFPVMSMVSGRANATTHVPANQYLNLEGKQFSKSSGWYVDAEEAVETVGVNALRYYLLSILPESSDSSFSWPHLQARVNGELSNNIGNLYSRCLKFWQKKWPEGLEEKHFKGFFGGPMAENLREGLKNQHLYLEKFQIKKALENAMALGQKINLHFTELAPWASFKEDPEAAAKAIGETSLMILILGIMLNPFLPQLSGDICRSFNLTSKDEIFIKVYRGDFSALSKLVSKKFMIGELAPLLVPKIEDDLIEKLQAELAKK